jgi:hypothetical protein
MHPKMKENLELFGASLLCSTGLWLLSRATFYRASDPEGQTPIGGLVREYFFWMTPWLANLVGSFVAIALIIAIMMMVVCLVAVCFDTYEQPMTKAANSNR